MRHTDFGHLLFSFGEVPLAQKQSSLGDLLAHLSSLTVPCFGLQAHFGLLPQGRLNSFGFVRPFSRLSFPDKKRGRKAETENQRRDDSRAGGKSQFVAANKFLEAVESAWRSRLDQVVTEVTLNIGS